MITLEQFLTDSMGYSVELAKDIVYRYENGLYLPQNVMEDIKQYLTW